MRFLFLIYTVFLITAADAQDSVLVTKNFKFEDGIYLTFESFQNNSPDYSWNEVNSQVFINGESFISKTENFVLKNGTQLPFFNVWGFSYNGIPYIRASYFGIEDMSEALYQVARLALQNDLGDSAQLRCDDWDLHRHGFEQYVG